MEKNIEKTLKLQQDRLLKVLKDLEELDGVLLDLSSDGNGVPATEYLDKVVPAVWSAIGNMKMAIALANCTDEFQELDVNCPLMVDYEGEDVKLLSEVKNIMLPYPFVVECGPQNVYKIKPATSLRELIAEVKKVFVREYNAGNCNAPHALEDFYIEEITVYNGNCAGIYVGS